MLAPPYPVVTSYTFGNGTVAVANAVSWAPHGLTLKAAPLVTDEVAGYDVAGATNARYALGSLPVSTATTAAIAAVTAAQGRYKGIVALSGARTLQLTDQGKLLQSAAVNSPVTVPLNATVAFTVGDQIDCLRGGAGTLSFVATGGVTFIIVSGATQIGAAGLGASLVYLGADTWWIVGGLIP